MSSAKQLAAMIDSCACQSAFDAAKAEHVFLTALHHEVQFFNSFHLRDGVLSGAVAAEGWLVRLTRRMCCGCSVQDAPGADDG